MQRHQTTLHSLYIVAQRMQIPRGRAAVRPDDQGPYARAAERDMYTGAACCGEGAANPDSSSDSKPVRDNWTSWDTRFQGRRCIGLAGF